MSNTPYFFHSHLEWPLNTDSVPSHIHLDKNMLIFHFISLAQFLSHFLSSFPPWIHLVYLTSRLRKANNSNTLNPTSYPELSSLRSNSDILETRFWWYCTNSEYNNENALNDTWSDLSDDGREGSLISVRKRRLLRQIILYNRFPIHLYLFYQTHLPLVKGRSRMLIFDDDCRLIFLEMIVCSFSPWTDGDYFLIRNNLWINLLRRLPRTLTLMIKTTMIVFR